MEYEEQYAEHRVVNDEGIQTDRKGVYERW